ncbi:MAG: hypothetical protein E7551_09895 [Ruminococcaceae bacterium]|nr:hypothetical protein [Oscillospiraceae bacterium]
MKGNLFSKSILTKLVAVIAAVALVFTLAPVTGVFDLVANASAETPVYDPTLGSYAQSTDVNGNTVLTASPNENVGFRGWYLKDGTEVSYETTYTLPSGTNASDYIPVFYNFNLIKNGGFEAYASGTNLSASDIAEDEKWNGITWEYISGTETGNWANSVKVTNAAAKSGNNSIVLNSPHHCTYKQINNLKPNTQYTLTYYFNIVSTTEGKDYLSRSYIVSGDITEQELLNGYSPNAANPYLDMAVFDATTGSCSAGEWKEVKHTFFTGENTSVKFLIYYRNEPVNNVRPPMYIDDVALVEDPLEAPSKYFDEDYSVNTVANWSKLGDGLSISHDSGKVKVDATSGFKRIQNVPFFAKKGAEYTVKLTFNFADLTDVGNYINFSLTTAKGTTVETGYYVQNFKGDTNFKAILTQGSNSLDITEYYNDGIHSNTCIQQSALSKIDPKNDIDIALSFKADKTTPVYLNVWINGVGSYTIDNLSVTENISNTDNVALIAQYASSTVGTAIRTEGKQGLRYKTQIDKRLLTSDMYYGFRVIEYGTAAIKADYANGSDLQLDGMYDYGENTYGVKKGVAYSFADQIDLVYAEDELTLDFTGVLTNIREEYYNTKYTVRAYFKYVDANGNTGIFYGDQNDIAIYPVSKAAYSAKNSEGEYTESTEVRNYLYENIISKYTDKIVKVSNASNPVYSNFQGIRSTVYHGVTFFPDSHGRTYTEAQAATEMDRLVDTKVDNVRTRFDSNWAWTSNGWDWNSTKMTAFYKWGKMLQDRDISITIQAGWHLYDFICFYNKQYSTGIVDSQDTDGDGHSSIPEVNYLHGYTDDASAKATAKYGEDANAAKIEADARAIGLDLTDDEFAHYSVAAARYGEWITQGINALKAQGLNNVEYVLPFTESGDVKSGDETYSYDEWIIMTMGLNNALENAGLRNSLKLIGPAQSIYAYQNRLSLVEYLYEHIAGTDYEDLVDINAMHQYTRPNTEAGYANTVFDPEASHSLAEENFTYYDDVLTNTGVRDMEFWCDEYFAHSPDAKWWNDVGMQMTQFAAGLTAGINNGVNRFLTWQMFDTLWDSDRTHGTGIVDNSAEFSGGVHAVGTCPSLVHVDGKTCPNGTDCPCTKYYNISSYVPRTTYYGINLIGKYMNNDDADVFETQVLDDADDNGGVYVSAIKNDEGKTVILVVNTTATIVNVDVELDNASSFNRYTYDPSEIVPTAEAKSLPSDKTISVNGGNTFKDTIPAQSFAIYVESGTFIGDDTNVDMGEFWK